MIIITGANGFIGSALVWELNCKGRTDLVCVDTVAPVERPGLLNRRQFQEFISAEALSDYLKEASDIEAIVHMGACSDTTEMDRAYLRRNNLEYTQKLWQWCSQNNKPFIYASSGATYGLGEHGFSDELAPEILRPLNPYGESKADFDTWAVRQKETPPVWFGLKFFNVYGPNEYHKKAMASVVYKAFNQIRDTGQLKLFKSARADYKDGEQMRDFVYVKDITSWIWQLLEQKSGSGIYNMGFGQARTWLDLARSVFHHMGLPLRIDWIDMPPELRDQYQYFTEARIDRLLSLGVHKPRWSLEAGIEDYVKNYLLQEDSYL